LIPKCQDLSKQKPRLTRSLTNELSAATNENEGFAQIDVRAQEVDVLDPEIGLNLIFRFFIFN